MGELSIGRFRSPSSSTIFKHLLFKEMFLKLETNGQSDKAFLLNQNFVPKGLSVPALVLCTCIKSLKSFFSSPEPSGSLVSLYWRHASIICLLSVHPPFSKIFSKTAGPKPNFMWSLNGSGEQKFVRSIGVTWPRWLPRPYMVKTLQKSSWEPKDQWPCSLVCSTGALGPIILCSNDDPRLTLTYFTARSNLVLLLYGENC